MAEEQKEYVEVDIQALAGYLAEQDFKTQTSDIPDTDIEVIALEEKVDGSMKVEKGIHSKFAHF